MMNFKKTYLPNILRTSLFVGLFFIVSAHPSFAANNCDGIKCIIPCDGPDCDFNALIKLVQNLMTYMILISVPISAIAFSAAGFFILTAGGDEHKISHGKEIFGKVLTGFIFVLAAWLIVYTITTALLNNSAQNYTLLK